MSVDLGWTYMYCLYCETQTDGAAFCSGSCRLAENENTRSASASSSSSYSTPKFTSSVIPRSSASGAYIPPAFNFTGSQPYGSSSFAVSCADGPCDRVSIILSILHESPNSIRGPASSASSASPTCGCPTLEKAKRELRAYASSFNGSGGSGGRMSLRSEALERS
ncbi:hypothetical protein F5883DRAFT_430672 [Diaporthe sp. PMI_573]|nr:hypothetical protein F5883DRAFT_430672 [Diaporthaceae sp. PMI_573]